MDSRSEYTGKRDQVEVSVGGCTFAGSLYEIGRGGCALYLSRKESELDNLETAHLTWLRNQSDSLGEIFIDELKVSGMVWTQEPITGRAWLVSPRAKRKAKRLLREWLCRNLPLDYGLRDQVREFWWGVAELLVWVSHGFRWG